MEAFCRSDLGVFAFFGGLIALAVAVTALGIHFTLNVAPSALERWAAANRYKIVRQRNGWWLDHLRFGSSRSQIVYRVTVADATGESREALVRVGSALWLCRSVDRCPVAVRWLPTKPAAAGKAAPRDPDFA